MIINMKRQGPLSKGVNVTNRIPFFIFLLSTSCFFSGLINKKVQYYEVLRCVRSRLMISVKNGDLIWQSLLTPSLLI